MNQDKAKELFSAYYEGSLDGGLRQSLEMNFQTDTSLREDYSAFVETMEGLDALRFEQIEIPLYLSDRIATRLETVQSKQKFGLPLFSNWIRGLAVGGVAIAALAFAVPIFRGDKTASTAGFSGGGSADHLTFRAEGSGAVLVFQPSGKKTVVVSSPLSGTEVQRFNLDSQKLESPIVNTAATPALFKVEVLNDKASSIVIVPGTATLKAKAGEGTIQELGVALAGKYHIPVVIEAGDLQHHVSWNFSSSDALTSAAKAVSTEGFSVDQRPGGLIKILDR